MSGNRLFKGEKRSLDKELIHKRRHSVHLVRRTDFPTECPSCRGEGVVTNTKDKTTENCSVCDGWGTI